MSEEETELSVETPEADAADQHIPIRDDERPEPLTTSAEANEADTVEQHVPVREDQLDEDDDYR